MSSTGTPRPSSRARGSRWARVVAPLAAVALLAACGSTPSDSTSSGGDSPPPAAQEGPIKVGALQSITGPLAVFGIAEQHAFEVAIEEINKSGGINGRQVEMIFYDPAGDTAKAVTLTRRLIEEDKVDLVVGGGTSSGIALAMKPLLQQAGIYFMSTEAAENIVAPAAESPLTFATTLSTTIVTKTMFDFLKEKGVKKAGMLGDSTAYGQSGIESAKTAAKDAGIELVAETYDPAATDLTPSINKLTAAGAAAFVNWTSGASGVLFMKNAETLKLKDKGPVMVSFTYSNPALMQQAAGAATGVTVAGVKATVLAELPQNDPERPQLQTLADTLKAKYGENVTIYASQSYDAMKVALEAVKKAGTTEGAEVAKANESLTFKGTQGEYKYSATDHRGLTSDVPIILEWDGSKFIRQDSKR